MSVTFEPQPVPTGRFTIVGMPESDPDVTLAVVEGEAELADALQALRATRSAEFPYGIHPIAESVTATLPSINMGQRNAEDVLIALGLPCVETFGAEDAAAFRARVLLALAEDRLDDALPTVVEGTEGATVVRMGRRAGYITEALYSLLAVAEAAEGYGVRVVWG